MPIKVMLTIQKGKLSGKTFTYEEKESLILGRQDDCAIILPETTVSRYHCLIDIAPPSVVVRDFGSLNGTYLNDEKIGQRDTGASAEEARQAHSEEFPMKPGDRLGLGRDCEIELQVKLPQYCAECFVEIEDSAFFNAENLPVCAACHEQFAAAQEADKKAKAAAEKAEKERLAAQKEAEDLAAKAKAAADAKEKAKAEQAKKEAEAKAAELKRKEEQEKKRKAELDEWRKAEQAQKAAEQKRRNDRRCEICGKSIGGDAPGICESCQGDPMKVLMFLMRQAQNGQGEAKQIAGYRNIKMLGRGGMGQVWLVEEEATGKQMALKLMLPKAAADEKCRETFLREAMVAGQLNHRNIIRQHKFGQSGDAYFILMELCDGGCVDDLLKKNGGKLSIDLATHIILQALDGLVYAHGAPQSVKLKNGKTVTADGIVHRDFKPANIFLCGNGKKPDVKVADFGLAKAFETSGMSGNTTAGQIGGTPVFMPRQQIINYRYAKPEVDVWAAAASYYHMLTGKFPKDFANGKDVFLTALNTTAVEIRKRDAAIPKKLAEVIDHALKEKPGIGVQSAAELKKMIEGAL